MRDAGVAPDVVTYTSLIAACQTCKRWADAERRWEAMLAEGTVAQPHRPTEDHIIGGAISFL